MAQSMFPCSVSHPLDLSHSTVLEVTTLLGDHCRPFGWVQTSRDRFGNQLVAGSLVKGSVCREEKSYLEIGDGVGNGEPGSPGVLLVAKGAIESLGDGTEVEGADGRSGDAVSER